MGILILAIVVLLVFDLLSTDSVLERILIPSASPPATPAERILDRLPERLPVRMR